MKIRRMFKLVIFQVLFVLYLYALVKIILFKFSPIDTSLLWQQLKQIIRNPNEFNSRLQNGNLTPFHEITRTIHNVTSHGLFNLIGNIVIFLPFGMFLGLLTRNKRVSWIGVFTLSLVLSLCLESAQVLFSLGSFDVDDLILNSSGGIIGYIAFSIYNRSIDSSMLLT